MIGIYGAWGEGKTSVLNFIKRALEQHDDVICAHFDPWRVGDEGQVLAGFFGAVAKALDESIESRGEKFAGAFKTYVSPLIPGIGPGLLGMDPSKVVDNVINRYFSVDLEKQRDRIESMLEQSGKRVVVLIDDIDRLERAEIQATFKLVKLTANFAHTAYVLAFDDSVVANALCERYGSGGGESGRAFLEKIIQVALHLPAASFEALNDYCLGALAGLLSREAIQLTDEQVRRFREGFDRGLRPELGTPRNATRYANALAFSLPLLRGEADPVDVMLIEGIRIFYPQLYMAIRDHRGSFLRRSNPRAHVFESEPPDADKIVASSVTEGQQAAVNQVIDVLFPRNQTRSSASVSNQAIADPNYFDRYFSYTVSGRDVSDTSVLDLIRELPSSTPDAVTSRLRTVATVDKARLLIPKLWRFANSDMPDEDLGKLAVGLSAAGDLFSDQASQLLATTPFGEAALLIQKLISRVSDDNHRQWVAKQVATKSEPVVFMAESFREAGRAWREITGEKPPSASRGTVHLPPYCEATDVRRVIRERIRSFMETQTEPHGLAAANLHSVLQLWKACDDGDEVGRYLRDAYSTEPRSFLALLTKFMPFDAVTGVPTDFLDDAYALMFDAMTSFVSAETVMDILRRMTDFERLRSEGRASKDIEERAAWGFVYVYKHRENQPTPEAAGQQ